MDSTRNGTGYRSHLYVVEPPPPKQTTYRNLPNRSQWARAKAVGIGLWIVGAAIGVGYTIAHESLIPCVSYAGGLLMGSLAWAFDRLGGGR